MMGGLRTLSVGLAASFVLLGNTSAASTLGLAGYPGRYGPTGANGETYSVELFNSLPSNIAFARASGGGHLDSSCLWTGVGTDQPRFNYALNASTGLCAPRGLLFEGQRTNLVTNSDNYATWSLAGGYDAFGAGSNATADTLAGAINIARMNENVIAATGHALQSPINIAVTSGSTYTMSGFAKPDQRQTMQLVFASATFGTAYFSNFNLVTGENGALGRSVAMPNGYRRMETTGIATSTANSQFFFWGTPNVFSSNRAVAYTGTDDAGLFYGGAQFEEGPFASSYIPTSGSSVTRAADSAIISDLSTIGFNPNEGTLVVEFDLIGIAPGINQTVVRLDDGGNNNFIRVSKRSTGNLHADVVAGGMTQAALDSGTAPASNTIYKVAVAWAPNSFAMSLNGASVVTDGAGTVPTLDRLKIGGEGENALFGHVRRLIYYPTRLSNAQLQSISS